MSAPTREELPNGTVLYTSDNFMSVQMLLDQINEMLTNDSGVTPESEIGFGHETESGVRVMEMNAVGTANSPTQQSEKSMVIFLNYPNERELIDNTIHAPTGEAS